jgi:thioredoxin 2
MSSIQINCPQCNASNRLPNERLADKPICGRCKNLLFTGKPLELHPNNLQITLSANQIPVLVDCWAPWCGPCLNFAPIFERAARRLEPNVRLAKLNTEMYPVISRDWVIRSIPTLILFNNAQEVARMSGALPLPQLLQWVQQHLQG